MTMRLDQVTRSAAALLGLCGITAVGVTASCFSERTTGTSADCEGTTSSPCVVDIRDFRFEPTQLRVPVGATVTWTNRGAIIHTSTSDAPGWDSGDIAPNASYSRPFAAAGSYAYHCEPHPTMQATILVVE
jgi:plastocyanin